METNRFTCFLNKSTTTLANKKESFFVILAIALMMVPNSIIAANIHNQVALNPIESAHFDSFKVADTAALPLARKIFIQETSVNFSDDWLKQFKKTTNKRYREGIQNRYAKMLEKKLKENLVKAGWTIVERSQTDALTVNAQFKDLHITAPDTVNLRHKLIYSVGKVVILLEVQDTNNKPFFTLEDRGNAGGVTGSLFETDRALNYSIFSQLANSWASNFVIYLDLSMDALANQT